MHGTAYSYARYITYGATPRVTAFPLDALRGAVRCLRRGAARYVRDAPYPRCSDKSAL